MNNKEAYERLELPEGTDLQAMRRKFAELYNDYRMRIDNAPTPRMRQTYEQRLAVLKEAYARLNGSDGMDDTEDLPHTRPTMGSDKFGHADLGTQGGVAGIGQALAVFGLNMGMPAKHVVRKARQQLSELRKQEAIATLPNIKKAYREELDKAELAWTAIVGWLGGPPDGGTEVPPNRGAGQRQTAYTAPEKHDPAVLPTAVSADPWFPRSMKWIGGIVMASLVMIFALLPGRVWEAFVELVWIMFTLVVGVYVVYNNYAAKPVPTWLSGKAFRGWWAVLVLIGFCVAGFVLASATIFGGRAAEDNPYIHWSYYREYTSLFLGTAIGLTTLTFVITGLIALIQPRILGFDHRGRVIGSGVFLFLFLRFAWGSFVLAPLWFPTAQAVASDSGIFSHTQQTDFPELQAKLDSLCQLIVFEYDSSVLPKGSQDAADEIGQLLRDAQDGQHFTLYCHYNDGGTEEYCMRVSEDRAQAIRMYWINMGVPPTAVDAVGWGNSELLCEDGEDPDCQRLNNRIEVIVAKL